MSDITRNNQKAWLAKLWQLIEFYEEEGIKTALEEGDPDAVRESEDLRDIMAWLREDLGLPEETGE